MFERDFARFVQLLDDAFSLNPNWKPLAPNGKALFFRALEPYSFEAVSQAMTAHIRDPKRGMFQPSPADLVGQIETMHGSAHARPGVDEAWALALTSLDEAETVVWTEEMRDAFGVCRAVLATGDKVGARMAFKDAYTRMAAEANRKQKPVKWEVSLGADSSRRIEAVRKAEVAGLLPATQAQVLLPGMEQAEEVNHAGLARLKAELAKLVPASQKAAERRAAQIQAQKDAMKAQKREINERVRAYGLQEVKHALAS